MVSPESYVLFVCAALLGVVATWINRGVAVRLHLVSKPNPIVPQHSRPVAHLGGVGIAAAAGLVFAVSDLLTDLQVPYYPLETNLSWRFALPGLGFLILGTFDDLRVFSPRRKFFFQILLAVAAACFGLVYPLTGLWPLDFGFSVLWIVTLVNAFNLTDVCDGLVGGLVLIILVFWAHFAPAYTVVAMTVAGACLGFLVFNFPPATIFLGDAGSHFLGYLVAAFTLSIPLEGEPWLRPIQMVLFAGVPIFELALLIVSRTRKRIPWWKGSPDHLALRLQAAGLSKFQTDAIVWSIAILLCAAALLLRAVAPAGQIAILLSVAVLFGVCWKLIQRWEVSAA